MNDQVGNYLNVDTIKRVGCGYRNESNYRRRIMLHSAAAAACPDNRGSRIHGQPRRALQSHDAGTSEALGAQGP